MYIFTVAGNWLNTHCAIADGAKKWKKEGSRNQCIYYVLDIYLPLGACPSVVLVSKTPHIHPFPPTSLSILHSVYLHAHCIFTPLVCLSWLCNLCVWAGEQKGGFRKARSYVTPASGPSDFGRLHNIDSLHLAELHFFVLSRVCSIGFPLLIKSFSYFLNLQRRKCHSIRTGINCPRGQANWRHMVSIYFNKLRNGIGFKFYCIEY